MTRLLRSAYASYDKLSAQICFTCETSTVVRAGSMNCEAQLGTYEWVPKLTIKSYQGLKNRENDMKLDIRQCHFQVCCLFGYNILGRSWKLHTNYIEFRYCCSLVQALARVFVWLVFKIWFKLALWSLSKKLVNNLVSLWTVVSDSLPHTKINWKSFSKKPKLHNKNDGRHHHGNADVISA